MSGLRRLTAAGIVSVSIAACGGGGENKAGTPASSPGTAPGASAPAAASSVPAAASAGNPCPLTVEQVAAITGTPMEHPQGGCTFFPANGSDRPHVFYVLQIPMVCSTIQPGEIGFTEAVAGLPATSAFVRDVIDGTHVLVCPNGNRRAFDVVVDLKDQATSRAAAIALAKQLLAAP